MKKIAAIIGVLLVMAVWTGCAKQRPPRPEDKVDRLIDKLSASLNFSEEQKVKVAQIKKEIEEKNGLAQKERRGEGKEIDEAFSAEIIKNKFDAAAINKLLDQKAGKKEDLRRFMVEELAKFHTLLTLEQKQKLAGLMKELKPEPPPHPEQGPEKR